MPWFRKSPSAGAAGVQDPAPAAADDVVVEPLTDDEIEWVRSTIAELADQDVNVADIDEIGRAHV